MVMSRILRSDVSLHPWRRVVCVWRVVCGRRLVRVRRVVREAGGA